MTPFFGQVVDGFSSGPPASIFPAICTTMSPFGHGASLFPSNTPIPYSISVEPMEYTPGEPLQGMWLILRPKWVVCKYNLENDELKTFPLFGLGTEGMNFNAQSAHCNVLRMTHSRSPYLQIHTKF